MTIIQMLKHRLISSGMRIDKKSEKVRLLTDPFNICMYIQCIALFPTILKIFVEVNKKCDL